ncbi:MAG: asparaginase [Alphaproteobacteria bacterium]
MAQQNPILVEVTRGAAVESRHRGAAAVCDAGGHVVAAWGDVDAAVFPRSAVKMFQALPLVESGAADRFAVSAAELALACASHNGERAHVDAAAGWLARMNLSERDLECGAHAPMYEPAATELLLKAETPSQLHNNCSGKHAGMLCCAAHLNAPTKAYIDRDHPVQRAVRAVLEDMSGCDLAGAPVGIDGCSLPTIAMPLVCLARAMARFADPASLGAARSRSVTRVRGAMLAHPFMVGGSGRFCTVAMQTLGGRVAMKTGAEGVYTAALPERGLGIALKIDDGAKRASEVAIGALLRHLGVIESPAARALQSFLNPTLVNRKERTIGEIRPAAGWLN